MRMYTQWPSGHPNIKKFAVINLGKCLADDQHVRQRIEGLLDILSSRPEKIFASTVSPKKL